MNKRLQQRRARQQAQTSGGSTKPTDSKPSVVRIGSRVSSSASAGAGAWSSGAAAKSAPAQPPAAWGASKAANNPAATTIKGFKSTFQAAQSEQAATAAQRQAVSAKMRQAAASKAAHMSAASTTKAANSDMHTGNIASVRDDAGYGFIDWSGDDGHVYFKLTEFEGYTATLKAPIVGQKVNFKLVVARNGRTRAEQVSVVVPVAPTLSSAERRQRRRAAAGRKGPALVLSAANPPAAATPPRQWLGGWVVSLLPAGDGLIKPQGDTQCPRASFNRNRTPGCPSSVAKGDAVKFVLAPGETRTIGARAEVVNVVAEMAAAPDGLPALPPPAPPSGGLAAALQKLSTRGSSAQTGTAAAAATDAGPAQPAQETGVGEPAKARQCSVPQGKTGEAAAWLRKLAQDPEQILLERSALAGLLNRRDLLSSDEVHDSLLQLLATRQARGAEGCRAEKVYADVKRSMWLKDASLLLAFLGRMALRERAPAGTLSDAGTHPSEAPLLWASKVLRYIVSDAAVASAVLKPLVEAMRSAAEFMQPPPSPPLAEACRAVAAKFAKREGTQLPAAKPPSRGIKMVAVAGEKGGDARQPPAGGPTVAALPPSHPGFTDTALAWAGARLPARLVGPPDDPLWREGTDFRTLSVFPSAAEVLSPVPPPLRALTVQGTYPSAFAYLDAHFRLLREDCVAPIRAGIAAYLHEKRREAIVSAQYQYARHHSLPLTALPPPPAPLPASRDVHVYQGVKLVGLVPGRQQLVYRIQLGHEARASGVNWARSKRLMYGSLLLLAMNDFGFKPLPGAGGDEVSDDTLLWATVQNRDEELIAHKGQLDIAFPDGYEPRLHTLLQRLLQENGSNADAADEDDEEAAEFGLLGPSEPVLKFTVVESSATYFEAYRHTLAALQSVDIDGFGRNTVFEALLRPPRVVLPPAYLTPQMELPERQAWARNTAATLAARDTAFAPPAPLQGKFVPAPVLDGALEAYPPAPPSNPLLPGKFPDAFRFPGIMPQLSEYTGSHALRVLQGAWPVVAEDEAIGATSAAHVPCQLDSSQLSAFKLSLTRELALVQGPPGTGKTYVGLQVVRSLLQNVVPRLSARPILVVCYTNHALDQFLEGILEVTSNIVRLGSRSKSEVLRPFNLRERVFGLLDAHKGKAARAAHASDASAAAASVEAASAAASATLLHHRRGIMRQLRELRGHIHDASVSMGSRVLYREDTADAALIEQYRSLWSDLQGVRETEEDADMEYEHLCSWLECSPLAVTDGPAGAEAAEAMLRASIVAEEEAARAADAHHDAMRAAKADAARAADARSARLAASPLEAVSVVRGRGRGNGDSGGSGADSGAQLLKALQEGTPTGDLPALDDDEEVTRIQQERQADGGEGGSHGEAGEEEATATAAAAAAGASGASIPGAPKFKHLEPAPSPIFPPPLSVNDTRGLHHVDPQHSGGGAGGGVRTRHGATKSSFMSTSDLESEPDVWRLPVVERRRLYRVWVWRRYRTAQNALADWCERYARVQRQLAALTRDLQLQILGKASVIGMTTTATAKYQGLIHALKPEIVIVEEAAEVLESHLVTALTSSVQQLIAIGDHQQLRPGTAVHELAKEKHLEVSLFERLVLNGVPHVTLSQQRRMRPEVSALIRTLYPALRDHSLVKGPARPHVRGMAHDVFFYNHTAPEGGGGGPGTSKQNAHEASMVAGLLSYLLGEGHAADSITVLSAYVGQLLLLKDHLRDMPSAQGVRLTTVDNYQGEENEIIILSLVRSNSQGSIGFLAEDNRACVALSRARCGMYVFGNVGMLASRSSFWAAVLGRVDASDGSASGAAIPITPGIDRNTEQGPKPDPMYVTQASEFPW